MEEDEQDEELEAAQNDEEMPVAGGDGEEEEAEVCSNPMLTDWLQ